MKKIVLRSILLAMMLCVLGIVASAQGGTTYRHAAGGIQFTSPANWKAEPDGDILTLTSPDEEMSIMFFVSSKRDFAAATEGIAAELDKIMKNVKFSSDGEEHVINGLQHFSIGGTGTIDGVAIEWDLSVINAKKPTIVVIFASKAAIQKYFNQYVDLLKSIKAL
jgi:hypothetical protein